MNTPLPAALLLLLTGLLPAQLPFSSPLRRVTFTAAGGNLDLAVAELRVSDDGRLVLFATDAQNVGVGTPAPGRRDLYLRDTATGQIRVLGIGLGFATVDSVHMTGDGRFVLFQGSAANGGFTGPDQVWLRDTQTGALELVTADGSGGPANGTAQLASGITGDGSHLLFLTDATNMPGGATAGFHLYRRPRQGGPLEHVIVDHLGVPRTATNVVATLTPNGRFVTFVSSHPDLVPGDTNGRTDLFLRDLQTGTTELLSVGAGGVPAVGTTSRPGIVSADGRFAVFATGAHDLVPNLPRPQSGQIFVVRDRLQDTVRPLAVSPFGFLARNGNSVFLQPPRFLDRTNIVVYGTDIAVLSPTAVTSSHRQIYATDIDTGRTVMVSNHLGAEGNDDSELAAISPDGRQIVFASGAGNLDPTSPAPRPGLASEGFLTSLDCFASSAPFGAGTAGTAGIVPLLFATDAPCSASVTVLAGGTLGGGPMFVVFGSPAVPANTLYGLDVHVDPQQPFTAFAVPNGGLPGVPGAGSWFTRLPVATLNNATLAMQVLCLDPGAPGGISATNGIAVQVN